LFVDFAISFELSLDNSVVEVVLFKEINEVWSVCLSSENLEREFTELIELIALCWKNKLNVNISTLL